ncbi:MAG: hypothetical protein Q9M97_02970, partial [Candidatus Gracilibacteria bacterium]|nr:hypothetical protein [Candidatus Gracilibacteria bacterium]
MIVASSTCTAYINHTVGNTLLFSKKIEKINIGENIEDFLDYKLNINTIYENLFYSQIFGSDMGLFVGIEIRIISKKYKDINNIFYIDFGEVAMKTRKCFTITRKLVKHPNS